MYIGIYTDKLHNYRQWDHGVPKENLINELGTKLVEISGDKVLLNSWDKELLLQFNIWKTAAVMGTINLMVSRSLEDVSYIL